MTFLRGLCLMDCASSALWFSPEPPAKQQKILEAAKEENDDLVKEYSEAVTGDNGEVPAEISSKQDATTYAKDTTAAADAPASEPESATPAPEEATPAPESVKPVLENATPVPESVTPVPESAPIPMSRPLPASKPAPAYSTGLAAPTYSSGLPPGLPPGMGGQGGMDSTIEEKSTVSALYVGRVIGKGG